MHPWLWGSEVSRDTPTSQTKCVQGLCVISCWVSLRRQAHHWYLWLSAGHQQSQTVGKAHFFMHGQITVSISGDVGKKIFKKTSRESIATKIFVLAGCPRYASIEAQSTI